MGAEGPEGPQGPSGTLDAALPTWDKLVAGLGGQAALQAMTGVTIVSEGARYQPGESPVFEGDRYRSCTFTTTTDWNTQGDWRLEHVRQSEFIPVPLTYSEVIKGNVGAVVGVDSLFGVSTGDMLSSRWAAVSKQSIVLYPHALLLPVLEDPSLAVEAGTDVHDGAVHEILELNVGGGSYQLWIQPATGQLSKLVTWENDHLHRDSRLEVLYYGWVPSDGGPAFASSTYMTFDGELIHEEHLMSLAMNPEFAATHFDLPTDSMAAFDRDLATWGFNNSQFLMRFSTFGIPLDSIQTAVQATEVSPGVYHLTGGSHHSMAIEQANGVVIFEAPLYPERSAAILGWVADTLGKPVTHVVVSHFHEDHAAGLREFGSVGAEVVSATQTTEYFARALSRPSTISPDSLSMSTARPTFAGVPRAGSYSIPDAVNPVEVYPLPNGHADDMVLPFLPNTGEAFVVDLYNPGNGGAAINPAWTRRIVDVATSNQLTVNTMVGGHGAFAPYQELLDFLAANGG